MQTAELPLFEFSNPHPPAKYSTADNEQSTTITEKDRLVAPLTQVLDRLNPTTTSQSKPSLENSSTFTQSLDALFPEQQYDEKDVQKAKEILGNLYKEFSPEQLKDTVTEIQYLCESWLDEFERETFDGLTLKELLHEKGVL